MKSSLKYIGFSVNESSVEVFKQYYLIHSKHSELENFLKSEFSDILDLKIHSSPTKTEFYFVSSQTSIGDFWTAVHMYLKIPYRQSVKYPEFKNEAV